MVKREWIDVSVPLSADTVVWPGDPGITLQRTADMAHGADANVTRLNMSVHTGTHIDAPLHFLQHGAPMDRLDLSIVTGTARVIEIQSKRTITHGDLVPHRLRKRERILLKTRNSRRPWASRPFDTTYAALSPDAAQYLVDRCIILAGIDYLSIGEMTDGTRVHRILLGANIWIVEGIDLRAISPGTYDMVCLPLNIPNAEAAPARMILRPRAAR